LQTSILDQSHYRQEYLSEPRHLNLAIVGAGIVGTATALAFSKTKHHLSIFDISKKQEEYSSEVLQRELGKEIRESISFCPVISEALDDADCSIVCVPTPMSKTDEAYDYSIIDEVMATLRNKMADKTSIIVRSTVDPLWLRKQSKIFGEKLWFIPEFLREETYLIDALHPASMIVGLPSFEHDTINKAELLFSEFNCPVHLTTLETAALVKLFRNAFLATKISFFNEVGRVAAQVGADPQEVANLVALDERVGNYGSRPGTAYSGKCLPKDTNALLKLFDLNVVAGTRKENLEMGGI
jgi:UDPglucose 6-dehydrogenase